MKTEVELMLLQAKKHQRQPAKYQKLKERPRDISLQSSEGTNPNPTNTMISDIHLDEDLLIDLRAG